MASQLVGALKKLFPDRRLRDEAPEASWEGRIREAAYTSPSGTRIVFTYEDVSTEIDKRTAAFDYPRVNNSYVQENGYSARRFPVRAIFWGANHDLIASAFEVALLESGVGKLEHPFYGEHYVIPFGTITRRDDLMSAANQSVIEVMFWTTLLDLYPLSAVSPRSALLAQLGDFNVAAANQFSTATKLTTAAARANVIATVREGIRRASTVLSGVASVSRAATEDFRDAQAALNFGLDVLIGQPLLLAQQVINMVTAPARAAAAVAARLGAYHAFYQSEINSRAGSSEQDASSQASALRRVSNDFHTVDLYVLAAVSGSCLSVVEHTFSTKPEALSAAEAIIGQLDQVTAWREARFESLGQSDSGESIQSLQHAVSLVAAYLVEISFTLVPERRVVLDRARTIVDLSAELYGSVDDERLNFLISSNDLTGSEILELPRGRSIAYYPQPTR